MSVKSHTFETGSNVTWNVANSGTGGDAISAQTGGGTATTSTNWAMTGTRSLLINTTANQARSEYTGLNTPNLSVREYWYFPALPTQAQDAISFVNGPKLQHAVTTAALKVMAADGSTVLYTFAAFSATTAYRIAFRAVKGTTGSGGTGDGTIECAIYSGHSKTPIESYSAIGTVNAGVSNYTGYYFGKLTGGSVTLNKHIDDVAYDDASTALLGPSVDSVTCTVIRGMGAVMTPAVSSAVTITPPSIFGWGEVAASAISSGVTLISPPVSGWGGVLAPAYSTALTIAMTAIGGWGGISAPQLSSGVNLTPPALSGRGSIPPPGVTAAVTVIATSVPGWGGVRVPALAVGVVLTPTPVSGWGSIRGPAVSAAVTLAVVPIAGWGSIRPPIFTLSTAISVILTTARLRTDRPLPSAASIRVSLTRALMRTGYTMGIILTRASMRTINNLPTVISAGPDKTVPPFTEVVLQATVDVYGLAADGWSWVVTSSNPRTSLISGISTTDVTDDTMTYHAPALVKGTVLTFKATAHITGRPDSTVTVVHTVRPHVYPWRMSSAGVLYPLNRFPVE